MDAQTTGKFISLLRKQKGITQTALAEKLNISNRTISKWEHGDGFPDITILPDLAEALGVSVDELLKGEKSENAVVVTEIENKNNIDNVFLIAYVISIFIGSFSALLGGITEIYCIWAFRILFYTHWEIIFAATSLFALILSGLVFMIGLTRLNVLYTREEIIKKTKKKIWMLSVILSIFPLSFLLRLLNIFIPKTIVWIIAIILIVVLSIILYVLYKRSNEINQ